MRSFLEETEEVSGPCLFCSQKALFLCNCNSWYCSKRCQKAHWKVHYMECEPSLTLVTQFSLPAARRKQNKVGPTDIKTESVTPKEGYFKQKSTLENSTLFERPQSVRFTSTVVSKQSESQHYDAGSNSRSVNSHLEKEKLERQSFEDRKNLAEKTAQSSVEFAANKQNMEPKHVKETQVMEKIGAKGIDKNSWVLVTHSFSPNSFYVQNQDDAASIEAISNILDAKCSQTNRFTPCVNRMCAALYDGVWYRGLVKGFQKNTYDVFYVDFGNYERIGAHDMCELPPELENIPKMAYRCVLEDIFPNRDDWESENKKFFSSIANEKMFIVESVAKKFDFYRLKLKELDSGKDLGQMMIDSKMCKFKDAPIFELPKLKVEYKEPSLSEGEDVELLTVLQGEDFFYAHLKVKNKREPFKFLKAGVEMKKSQLTILKSVTPGEHVIAFSRSLGTWYRAIVLNTISPKEIEVFFIDYGNDEVVEQVAALKQEWASPAHLYRFTSNLNLDYFMEENMSGEICKISGPQIVINLPKNIIIEGQLLSLPKQNNL